MGDVVRVGVIGRGFGAQVVAPAYDQTEGCDVVDVAWPRDAAAVRALCARRDIDLIAVHSPPFLHLEHVRMAVDHGHAVVCDKPFGRNVDDATEMHRLAEAAGVRHFVNFEMRFDPARQRMRELLRDGLIGRPLRFSSTYVLATSRVPLRPYGWLFDVDLGGGWMRSIGSHMVDFTRWSFGEVVASSAQLQTAITERPDADGTIRRCTADDGFTAVLRTEQGVTATIDSTFAAPENLTTSMVVVGTEGVLELVGEQRMLLHAKGRAEEVFRLEALGGGIPNQLMIAMLELIPVVRDAVLGDDVHPDAATFTDGLACVELLDGLRR